MKPGAQTRISEWSALLTLFTVPYLPQIAPIAIGTTRETKTYLCSFILFLSLVRRSPIVG